MKYLFFIPIILLVLTIDHSLAQGSNTGWVNLFDGKDAPWLEKTGGDG